MKSLKSTINEKSLMMWRHIWKKTDQFADIYLDVCTVKNIICGWMSTDIFDREIRADLISYKE